MKQANKQKAIKSTEVSGDIITAAESGKRLVEYWGLKAPSSVNTTRTTKIYSEFVFNLEYDKAIAEYDKILKAGMSNIYFGWIGETAEIRSHYYIINDQHF